MLESRSLKNALLFVTQAVSVVTDPPNLHRVIVQFRENFLRVIAKGAHGCAVAECPLIWGYPPTDIVLQLTEVRMLGLPLRGRLSFRLVEQGRDAATLVISDGFHADLRLQGARDASAFADWEEWFNWSKPTDATKNFEFHSPLLAQMHSTVTAIAGPKCRIRCGFGGNPCVVDASEPGLNGLERVTFAVHPVEVVAA